MLGPGEPLQNTSVMETSVTDAYKSQIWVGTGVPASRVEARGILGVVKKNKIVLHRPVNQAFSICTDGVVIPVRMLAIKITRIEAGLVEHQDSCGVSREGKGL